MEANDGRGEPDPVVVVGIVIAGTSGALAAPVGAHDALGLLACPADRGGCQPQLKPEAMTAGDWRVATTRDTAVTRHPDCPRAELGLEWRSALTVPGCRSQARLSRNRAVMAILDLGFSGGVPVARDLAGRGHVVRMDVAAVRLDPTWRIVLGAAVRWRLRPRRARPSRLLRVACLNAR